MGFAASSAPLPSVGILLLGAVAVLAAGGALVRFYSRAAAAAAKHASTEAGVEIPAPQLETLPAEPATRP